MNSTTWQEALERCTEQKSILADITDVKMNYNCNRIDSKNASSRYWVGNFYKLSNMISIEGPNLNTNDQDLRSPISQDDLPYICNSSATNRPYTNGTLSKEDNFRFGIYASVKREFEDKPAVAVKCISISCFRHFTIKVRSQNCSLTTNGFVCVKLKSKNDSITSFTTSSSPKSSLNMSSVVQQPVNKNFHDTTRSISPRTKSSILPAAFKGKVQSEATRLHISSTRANNFKNPSSHVPQKKNILESTTTGLSDPLVKCHSKIGFIIAGVLGTAIVIIVTVSLLVICWLRQKGPFKKKSLYEDIQVNELDNSKYQEIGVDSDQIRRVAVQKVESDVEIISKSETWQDALGRCIEHNSSLANVTDIELNHFCERGDPSNVKNTYWVGNFYKLSNRISIEGKYSKENYYLKTPVPQDELPYICESYAANSTTSVDYFRFGVNASVKQESNISHESTIPTTRISSPTMLTISNHLNTALKAREHNESASYDTSTSKITTTTTFQQQPSVTPSQDNIKNSQGDITSPARSSTEVISKTKGVHTTSSMKYSSLHTSSYVHITYLDEMNNAESTTGSVDTLPSGHSKIGLIVGSAVATVFIIVAVVLLVSCRLRRWELFSKKNCVDDIQINEINYSNNQDNNSNTEPCDVHNTMYDMQTGSDDNTKFGLVDVSPDNSNNILNTEYAVVVKNNQSGNQVIDENCGTNGEISDDPLESEYDRFTHVRPRSGKDSSNIYDSALGFREECDATYNTTVYRGIDKGDDSVYDHI
ncbi:unnamed protein product [Mytilus coruscus]|uniref:C-type lectin domain-containing protein n=1 Tax=Mytilus coruscus TaxID=42192 RepID=A0A6J8DQX3_MYTCO|nr:unnamed protein product [Mytilus coruscus]